jgi:hypothetical protein
MFSSEICSRFGVVARRDVQKPFSSMFDPPHSDKQLHLLRCHFALDAVLFALDYNRLSSGISADDVRRQIARPTLHRNVQLPVCRENLRHSMFKSGRGQVEKLPKAGQILGSFLLGLLYQHPARMASHKVPQI